MRQTERERERDKGRGGRQRRRERELCVFEREREIVCVRVSVLKVFFHTAGISVLLCSFFILGISFSSAVSYLVTASFFFWLLFNVCRARVIGNGTQPIVSAPGKHCKILKE